MVNRLILTEKIEKILTLVERPARYTGHEYNSIKKDFASVTTRIALAFPDLYDIGMAYPGFQILYHLINSQEHALAARVFAPWPDMAKLMAEHEIPLFTLEEHRPVREYDMVGFTLQYELGYPAILQMLHQAGIPLYAAERSIDDPFVIAGGPCTSNPEPVAPFFDLILLGESEEALPELIEAHRQWRASGANRQAFLERAAEIGGIYIPSFYEITYQDDGTIAAITPTNEKAPSRVKRRILRDLDHALYPTAPVIPYVDVPHNRMILEVFRGCQRGCRFCQAGYIYRPVREKKVQTLTDQVQELIRNTGFDEVSLMSLSTSDYSCIRELLVDLNEILIPQDINISLPSLRIDNYDIEIANQVQKVRSSGLTLAPEAGTQRMRNVINKQVTEEDVMSSIGAAVESGLKRVKLYFMIGLPTEEEQDFLGIIDLGYRVAKLGQHGPLNVTISAAGFVPKPHTPFQWVAQDSMAEFKRKQKMMLSAVKRYRYIKFNYHDAEISHLEAVLARGDRRLAPVIERAVELGAYFDGWSEYFQLARWEQAWRDCQVDPAFYAQRQRPYSEILPWDHLDSGVTKEFLWAEYQKALNVELTLDCREGGCTNCGVCMDFGVDLEIAREE